MKYVFLFIQLSSLANCYSPSYPVFDLRKPIYLVRKANYRLASEANGLAFAYRQQIVDGIGMWFAHLPPKKRPQIILVEEAPKKTKNEVIFIDYDKNLDASAKFRWTVRPLTIIVKEMFLGKRGYLIMAHEFGHAILGVEHRGITSIMHINIPVSRVSPNDIQRLHEKHPELSRQ